MLRFCPQISRIGVVCRLVRDLMRVLCRYCGILLPSTNAKRRFHLFQPYNRQLPRIRIQTRQAEALQGKRIVVAVDDWPAGSRCVAVPAAPSPLAILHMSQRRTRSCARFRSHFLLLVYFCLLLETEGKRCKAN